MRKASDIVWHQSLVNKRERQEQNGHKSCVIWFTGLSGSGKSTLANALDFELFRLGIKSFVLDGDNIRHGLNKDLGFDEKDRKENIRRIGEVAKLFVESGTLVSTAFISPFQEDRDLVRRLFEPEEFIEVYVHCPLEVCESREPKGLYRRARNGEIKEFTGISSPYQAPVDPDLVINTDQMSVPDAVRIILLFLKEREIIQ